MNLTFQCIDNACESADQSFFPPHIVLTARSTTQIATVIGFDEYIPSTPPKRYRTLTWSGTSEQQLWNGPTEQVAGARFDYSGSSTIDDHGNYTSFYTKNLSEMCNAADGLITTFLPGVSGGLENYAFSGWLGPAGHEKCNPPGIPYSFVSNQAIARGDAALNDSSPLWGSKKPNPTVSNAQVSDFNVISSTMGFCLDAGGSPSNHDFIALFNPVPEGVVPPISNETEGTVWFFAGVVWDHDYTSELTNEYTDADALANAQVVTGNGTTAENFPRTSGYISRFTNVVFTLSCTNLIVGQDYLVSIDFWDSATAATTTRQYGVHADKTTHSIVDICPTPNAQHTLQVRNPRIAFA